MTKIVKYYPSSRGFRGQKGALFKLTSYLPDGGSSAHRDVDAAELEAALDLELSELHTESSGGGESGGGGGGSAAAEK